MWDVRWVLRGLSGALATIVAVGAVAGAAQPERDDRSLGCRNEVSKIETGFGAPGARSVIAQEIDHPAWPGRKVTLHRPSDADAPVPVVFFAHGFGATQPVHYRGLVEHMVSRGLAVVYAPYRSGAASHAERYRMLWAGFAAAAEQGAPWLDLTRTGFLGHSFGGGATPELARRGLVESGWGSSGAFVMVMAPWYVLGIDDAGLSALPPHTRVLVQVYEDERINDHRIAIELFDSLGNGHPKSFVLIRSDRRGLCRLRATHTTPVTDSVRGRVDGLDRHGVFRLVDALAADAFEGDPEARALLFPGEARALPMGSWPDGTPVTPAHIGPTLPASRPPSGYYFGLGWKQRWLRATELGF